MTSITGEKLTESQVTAALLEAVESGGYDVAALHRRRAVGRAAALRALRRARRLDDDRAQPRASCARYRPRALRSRTSSTRRSASRQRLGAPVLKRVAPGSYQALRQKRVAEGAPESQVKIPQLSTDMEFGDRRSTCSRRSSLDGERPIERRRRPRSSRRFAGVPLFVATSSARQRARLARFATTRRYQQGSTIVRQGDTSMSLYVVLSGAVRVDRESEGGGGASRSRELGRGRLLRRDGPDRGPAARRDGGRARSRRPARCSPSGTSRTSCATIPRSRSRCCAASAPACARSRRASQARRRRERACCHSSVSSRATAAPPACRRRRGRRRRRSAATTRPDRARRGPPTRPGRDWRWRPSASAGRSPRRRRPRRAAPASPLGARRPTRRSPG